MPFMKTYSKLSVGGKGSYNLWVSTGLADLSNLPRAVVPKLFTVLYPFRHSISSYVPPTSDPNLLRLLFASHQQNIRLKKTLFAGDWEYERIHLTGCRRCVCVSTVEKGGVAGAEFSTDVTHTHNKCDVVLLKH